MQHFEISIQTVSYDRDDQNEKMFEILRKPEGKARGLTEGGWVWSLSYLLFKLYIRL
jgi:hypothetical protein